MHAKILPNCHTLKIICYNFGSLLLFAFETLQSKVSKRNSIGIIFSNKKTSAQSHQCFSKQPNTNETPLHLNSKGTGITCLSFIKLTTTTLEKGSHVPNKSNLTFYLPEQKCDAFPLEKFTRHSITRPINADSGETPNVIVIKKWCKKLHQRQHLYCRC